VYHGSDERLGYEYPGCAAFNAVCLGTPDEPYFVHNLKCTDAGLLRTARRLGMTLIDVKQGYTKCNVAVVDPFSVITSDAGIARKLSSVSRRGGGRVFDVLLISAGSVALEGFDYGFIGGACGLMPRAEGPELVFNGNLPAHPDFAAIKEFAGSRGVALKWFDEYELTDIGSVVFEETAVL
jgi:hypothetical protein